MQRDGYTREAATHCLASHNDPLALRLLMLRCNDVVPQVSTAATQALARWLTPSHAPAWSHALPLVEAMHRTVRASRSGVVETVDELLCRPGATIDTALSEAARTGHDPETRRLAIAKLVRRPVTAALVEDVLGRGLADAHPRVRLSSAQLVGTTDVPAPVRAALLPRLEASASPNVRLLALRARRKLDPSDAVRYLGAATLDANANVRHYARRYSARMEQVGASRDRALLCLTDPSNTANALVGALAALSDVGRAEDREHVRPFVAHAVRRVQKEAARTLAVLAGGAG